MIALFLWLIATPAFALDVVCTLPWLGSVTREIAPDATITVLASGTQDPHYLSPTPALIAKVRQADLYVENGMNLELWSTRLLDGAGNPRIRPGQPGYVRASDGAHRLQVPTELTRAQGDLHPEGNPHIWTDPLNLPTVADNIAAGLGRVDPENAATYTERAAAFRQEVYVKTFGDDLVSFMGGELLERLARAGRLEELLESKGLSDRLGGWMAKGRPLRGRPIVFYHQSWIYFEERFGLKEIGMIEDRPGISPSAAHRAELAKAMEASGADLIAIGVYYDDRLARVLASETGAKVVVVPNDVGGTPEVTDWAALYDTLIERLSP